MSDMKTWILFYLVVFTMFTVPAQQSFLQKAHADTITWTGIFGDGTNWSDPANWGSNTLPQFGDNIIIPSGSDVTLDISFNLGGSLYVAPGATLTINQLDIDENDIDNLLEIKKYRSFCVIRDPIKRWISGVGEFMTRYDGSTNYIIEQVKNKKYIFDFHTAPQHLSVDVYLPKLDNTYLKLDNKLESKINKLLCSNRITLDIERESNLITKLTCEKIFEKYVRINLEDFYNLYRKDFVLYGMSI